MAGGSEQASVIEREVKIRARPDTLFAFFTDPEKIVRWKGMKATLDPQPGGIYRVQLSARAVVRGEYREVVPFRRVVFTWGWEGEGNLVPPGSSTVEVTLEPDGDGTIVRLRHYDLPAAARDSHLQGWEHYLPRLATVAAGGELPPDPWAAEAESATSQKSAIP